MATAELGPQNPQARGDGSDGKWWTLGVVCIAVFMLLLDVTVVNNALPSIQKDLGSSFSDLQWVVDAYALTLAAFLLTFGSLADLFGRRLVFVLGLGVFSAASLACGLSTTPLMLNLARAIQGIGAAGMFACSLALIASAWATLQRPFPRTLRPLFILLLLAMVGVLSKGADDGGRMVYDYNAGWTACGQPIEFSK